MAIRKMIGALKRARFRHGHVRKTFPNVRRVQARRDGAVAQMIRVNKISVDES